VPLVSLYLFLNAALIDFYEETDGSNWAFQAEWLSDDSVCTWYGIECNANSSVVGIRLNNNRLANTRTDGDGSASLFNLPNLEVSQSNSTVPAMTFSFISSFAFRFSITPPDNPSR
jgi:hypothetical protein